MKRLIAIDVETTGLDPDLDRVVEFAAVDFSPFLDEALGVKKEVTTFHTMINPGFPMPKKATQISGIRDEDLIGASTFEEKAPEILNFIKGATLVAHNAKFDKAFLKAEFERAGIEFKAHTVCSLALARSEIKGLESYKLESLNARYSLHPGKAHRALDDAITAGKLYLMIKKIGKPSLAGTQQRINPEEFVQKKLGLVGWIVVCLMVLVIFKVLGAVF